MKKLTEAFNKVSVKKGETFMIELPSNPSTGYAWDVRLKAGKASLVNEGYISSAPPESGLVGGGGRSIFIFKAEETGTIEIEADYKRAWEKKLPIKSQSFSITVG